VAGDTDDDLVEIIPEADDWDLVTDDKIIVNPFDEKVQEESKEDVIPEGQAKEIEDINKMPSGTTAAEVVTEAVKKITDSTASWEEIKSNAGVTAE
jgi:hypothetical protein